MKTAEDFGTQGEPPSHRKLLDWLAVDFRESGWNVNALMRQIVLRAAYRRTSRITPDQLAKDPANRLLARGPRFRLDGEMLRDQALRVGGLLIEEGGRPGRGKPPQPRWPVGSRRLFCTSNTRNFTADAGDEKVHRRSLYTFWKRTSPPPQMSTFDAPSSGIMHGPAGERTNTPLQAALDDERDPVRRGSAGAGKPSDAGRRIVARAAIDLDVPHRDLPPAGRHGGWPSWLQPMVT